MSLSAFTIRQANLDDLEVLIQLRLALLHEAGLQDETPIFALSAAIRDYLIQALSSGEFIAFVAESDRLIIGTSGVVFFKRPPLYSNLAGVEAYIMNIYTRPQERGKGVATALMAETLNFIRKTEARRIWLQTTEAGKPLYEKFGFTSTDNEMELLL